MIIPFEENYRKRYYALLDNMFDSSMLSDGEKTREFERAFENYIKLPSCAIASGGAGLLAILEYLKVADGEVIVPDNTFWATTQAVRLAGATPVFADCNKEDLCLSFEDMKKLITPKTKAVIVVHIGGHIAFQIEEIAAYCNEKGIPLVEDCAHVHGGWWNGKTGGHFGFAGSYSFYATKTMPIGDGGMVVSKDKDFLKWVSEYRNYGKRIVDGKVTYPIKNGFNFRINEFASALGILQIERLPEILKWKRALAAKYDEIFDNRVKFPKGMESGYYKYIVFDYKLKEQTGQVFGINDLGTSIMGLTNRENSRWVAQKHSCAPIYYGWDKSGLSAEELKQVLL